VRLLAGKKTLGRGPKRHTLFFQPSIERTVVPLPGSTRRPASSSRSSRRTGPRAKHAESPRQTTRHGANQRAACASERYKKRGPMIFGARRGAGSVCGPVEPFPALAI
jgi:hypothetical protein